MSKTPLEYIFVTKPLTDDQREVGISGTGWYFWDETWSYMFGPFCDYNEAYQKYCELEK